MIHLFGRFLYLTLLLIALLNPVPTLAQASGEASSFTQLLDFELGAYEGEPARWRGGPKGTLFADSLTVHGGQWSGRLERDDSSANTFSTLTASIPSHKQGKTITLKGYLKTDSVSKFAGLWLRLDDTDGTLALDNMQNQSLSGSNDWAEYTISLPFNPETHYVYFGALVSGQGKVWVDDLQLLVDGKPYDQAPELVREITVLDTDTEFVSGSAIDIRTLDDRQVRNLALLAKVWGFLKYHHPAVTGGTRHWDFELFRIMPHLLAAADAKEVAGELISWIDDLGEIPPCEPCAKFPEDLQSQPRLDWLGDENLLGRDLSQRLQNIHDNRPVDSSQFYISHALQVGNPKFEHEPGYIRERYPDPGYRLLALFRYWNIIEYWFPNRDIIDRNWDEVLKAFIPQVLAAEDKVQYQLAMMKLIAEVKDGHANLYSADQHRPPVGEGRLPVVIRFVEGQAVVYKMIEPASEVSNGTTSELQIGDVIKAIDGEEVSDLIEQWAAYYPASNQTHRLHSMARNLTRGPLGPCELKVERAGKDQTLQLERTVATGKEWMAGRTHDLPGDTFQLLNPEVAYLKLSSVEIPGTADYLEKAVGTKGLIIDIRNYPSQFMVFALGGRLVRETTPFVCFTHGEAQNPGAFSWGEPISLFPHSQTYDGKVVILVDETSMSQAEYTAMAFRVAPEAMVVGSTTAGADGNISAITLPGGLKTHISGIGVFYPDRSPTQRVGIIPDLEVWPTVEGIRQGRDEVLEAAMELIE